MACFAHIRTKLSNEIAMLDQVARLLLLLVRQRTRGSGHAIRVALGHDVTLNADDGVISLAGLKQVLVAACIGAVIIGVGP